MEPKKTIQHIESFSSKNRKDYLRLDYNENVNGPSPQVIEAIYKAKIDDLSCYPDYSCLIEKLASVLNIPQNTVFPTNGSDEAIKLLFDIYIQPGDEIILFTPSYFIYEHCAKIVGAKVVLIAYEGKDFSFPLHQLLEAISEKTRFIVIVNPNNPTGTLVSKEIIEKVITVNPKIGVIIDEAYVQFSKLTCVDYAISYPNVFVLQTFSKAYGLAGLRMGYIISHKDHIEVISKVAWPFYTVNSLGALSAIAALEDQSYADQYVEETSNVRSWFIQEMESLGWSCVPSFGNFVLVNFGQDATPFYQDLEEKKILVSKRKEESLNHYLRITIGTKKQMEKVVEVLKEIQVTL